MPMDLSPLAKASTTDTQQSITQIDDALLAEEKELVRFDRADEYLGLLRQLLPPHALVSPEDDQNKKAEELLKELLSILEDYQEQPYLLDPYLDDIVAPPVEALQKYIKADLTSNSAPTSLNEETVRVLSKLIYNYTKIRGYKVVINFFPHEVTDLPATLAFLEKLVLAIQVSDCSDTDVAGNAHGLHDCWELRYVAVLWLSLICMIPFDLSKFDASNDASLASTAVRIEAVGTAFIVSPGKERDAAAVLLGKLFQRQDVVNKQLESFVQSGLACLRLNRPSPFATTGILQALCEIVKISHPRIVTENQRLIQSVLDTFDQTDKAFLLGNSLVLKYRIKLIGRVALKSLRPRQRTRFVHVKTLGDSFVDAQKDSSAAAQEDDDDDEDDVPEEVEIYISQLIDALQHKDTLVRYSASKGLARLCDRLPRSFITQVCDAVVSLFEIGIPDLYQGANNLSSVSEHTWQGACMALAELARRGLLFVNELAEKVRWIEKALLFDVRRGAHSVGANVRDSACYVLWALARAHDSDAIKSFAPSLANKLVAVATLDREVSIRRAASAAFQEAVGRLDLFPHGLEVIRLTDFYAVSIRRNAFLECAVQVARLNEYQDYLMQHLLNVTILHWDPQMRILGAKTLAMISTRDRKVHMPVIVAQLSTMLSTTDVAVLHGVLLSLAEVCDQCRSAKEQDLSLMDDICSTAFGLLEKVADNAFKSIGAAMVLVSACRLIGAGASPSMPNSAQDIHKWQRVLNIASTRSEEIVQMAAAEAVGQVSQVLDLTFRIRAILDGWTALALAQQQSNSIALGTIDYVAHAASFEPVICHLIALVSKPNAAQSSSIYSSNIEIRRNAFDSMTSAFVGLNSEVSNVCTADQTTSILHAMLTGLDDYTSDQRGDVGSWVRLSCITGIRTILVTLHAQDLQAKIPQALFSSAVASLWKQAAERIDHVRQTAASNVIAIYRVYRQCSSPRAFGYELVEKTFDLTAAGVAVYPDDAHVDFKDPKYAYPRLAALLQISPYRKAILEGLVVSVGSKSDLGCRIIGPALSDFLAKQHERTERQSTGLQAYTVETLLLDLFELAKMHFGNNRIFVPAVQTVNIVVENGTLDLLPPFAKEREILFRLLKMVNTNVRTTKNIARVLVAGTLTANLLSDVNLKQSVRALVLDSLAAFLSHDFPTVRAKVAEHLYFVVSTSSLVPSSLDTANTDTEDASDSDRLEILLLDTKWAAPQSDNFAAEAADVVQLLTRITTTQT